MTARTLPKIVVLIAASVSVVLAQTPGASGIDGRIMISPMPPRMTRTIAFDETPLVNAPFAVADESGRVIASFATDDRGRFRVFVSAGHYTVSQADNKSQIRQCGPWGVDIVAGQMTKVEWYCNMGGAPLGAAASSLVGAAMRPPMR